MAKIIISSNPENLKSENPSHTVEAEYGDICVEGSILTLAHHGPRSGNPAPCNTLTGERAGEDAVIGLSHIDLDCLGGVMALLGQKPNDRLFWSVAEQVDLRGAHKLDEIIDEHWENPKGASPRDLLMVQHRLHAWWAWNDSRRLFPPRDGSVQDVTEEVLERCSIISRCIAGDEELLADGYRWKQAQDKLSEESFLEAMGPVVVRQSTQFVNHLYSARGKVFDGCVSHNPETGSVTVSIATPDGAVSCRDIVQHLWGPEAGGHVGIAGSPRGQELEADAAMDAARILGRKLAE